MSATNRKAKNPKNKTEREENDFYPTPEWTVHRFLEKTDGRLPGGLWLEPCAGEGAIISAVRSSKSARRHVPFHAVELQERFIENLLELPGVYKATSCNFLDWKWLESTNGQRSERADVIITNPPYTLAYDMVKHALKQADAVCMLLRINFLASELRCEWMQEHTPDIFVLPNRPSFRGKGTDACEYAWFLWDKHSNGKITILNSTPKSVRMAEKKKQLSNKQTI